MARTFDLERFVDRFARTRTARMIAFWTSCGMAGRHQPLDVVRIFPGYRRAGIAAPRRGVRYRIVKDEAKAYLEDPVLGPRLKESANLL